MYPKTILTRPMRITIMLFLILSFFVISPLIILYTAGYRYDLKSGVVRETGVLSVDVEPDDVSVFLDDVLLDKSIPIRLTNLIPATYHLLIQRDGYLSWEKDVVVGSKQTTYIRNVELFKEASPKLFLDITQPIIEMSTSYDGLYIIIVTKQDSVYETLLINTGTEEITTILQSKSTQNPSIEWSPFEHHAIIQSIENKKLRTHIFSAEDPNTVRSYTHKNTVSAYQWPLQSEEAKLFIQDDNKIIRLGSTEQELITNTSSTIWYVDIDDEIWITNKEKNEIIYKPNTEKIAHQIDGDTEKIIAIRDKYIITKTNDSTKVLLRDGDDLREIHSLPTQSIRYNHSTDEWIAWSPWEIWNIYEDGSAAFLNRTSEQIDDVLSLDKFGVLLLARKASLTSFNPGYFVDHTLLDNIDIKSTAVRVDKKIIFFLGDIENKTSLWQLSY